MKILKILSNKALPALFWLLIMFAFDSPCITVATLISAAIHEMGHVGVMAIIERGKISMPRAVIFGLRLRKPRLLSYKEELILALGGPLANIGVFILLIPFFDTGMGYIRIFSFINLLTAISNLLPVKGNDGFRALSCIFAPIIGEDRSTRALCTLSFLFSAFAVFTSLFFIMKIGEGYWIFALFFAILVKDILNLQKRINLENS